MQSFKSVRCIRIPNVASKITRSEIDSLMNYAKMHTEAQDSTNKIYIVKIDKKGSWKIPRPMILDEVTVEAIVFMLIIYINMRRNRWFQSIQMMLLYFVPGIQRKLGVF